MVRRWNNKTLSIPYYTSLQGIPSKSITFWDRFPSAEDIEKHQKQVKTDSLLLASIDDVLICKLGIEIPKLVRAAQEQTMLYTQETCTEFHVLVCALLKHFGTSLQQLGEYGSKLPQSRKDFEDSLGNVLYFGSHLQLMVSGFGIDHYLQDLQAGGSLPDHRREVKLEDGEDADPDLGEPSAITNDQERLFPFWKSYKEWLKVILSYFNAVDILTKYVKGKLFCPCCRSSHHPCYRPTFHLSRHQNQIVGHTTAPDKLKLRSIAPAQAN